MSEDSLQDLATRLQAFATARNWGRFHAPKNLACALTVEAAELLEHFQWMTEEESRQPPPARRQEVSMEMADVLLYLLQLANELNIDLVEAAQRKLTLNEVRFPTAGGDPAA